MHFFRENRTENKLSPCILLVDTLYKKENLPNCDQFRQNCEKNCTGCEKNRSKPSLVGCGNSPNGKISKPAYTACPRRVATHLAYS